MNNHDGSLFWAPDGTPRFSIITLVSIIPLIYTGHYVWAGTALLATVLTACCNAMQDLDIETKTNIRLNIISPEDILQELENATTTTAQDDPSTTTIILSTGLDQLSKKYYKQSTLIKKTLSFQEKKDPKDLSSPRISVTTRMKQKQRLEELALICQQGAYICLQKCPYHDGVVAAAISLLALIAKHDAVRERHVQDVDIYGLHIPMQCIQDALERAKMDSSHYHTPQQQQQHEKDNEYLQFNDMPIAQQQAELQRKACLWLGALAGDPGGLNDIVLQEGGLSILLNAADWYRNHSEVVTWALWALFELCQDHVKRKAALVEQNGVTIVLQSMKTTLTEKVEVARHGLAIVFDIMRTDPQDFVLMDGPLIDMYKVKHAALTAGIHDICLLAMKSYPDKAEIIMMGQALLIGTSYRGTIPTFSNQVIS